MTFRVFLQLMWLLCGYGCSIFLLQLIFSDRIHRTLWVTKDEGETYTSYTLPFTPDDFTFQSTRAPGSDSETLSQYLLGYDSAQQTVRQYISTRVV